MYAFADALISALSLMTLCYLLFAVRVAFKKHYMNIFSHLMLILLVFSLLSKYIHYCLMHAGSNHVTLLVRSLFFLTHLDMFKYQGPDKTVGDNVAVFSLIWTYPLINNIVVSYTTSSHWVYDLMTLLHGN